MFRSFVAAILLSLISVGTQGATILYVSAGKLTGATGVDVGGTLYDVWFRDGSCFAVFSGCSQFTFDTWASAEAASTALLASVLVNEFDEQTRLTEGCYFAYSACNVVTPFGLENGIMLTALAVNGRVGGVGDFVTSLQFRYESSEPRDWVGPSQDAVYAVWLAQPSAVVPVPPAVYLFGSALGVMGWMRRKLAS